MELDNKSQKRPRESEAGEGIDHQPAPSLVESQSSRIDPNLKNEPLNETDLQAFGHVVHVAAADSDDFNAVTVLRVVLFHSATKATEERVISKRAFTPLHMSKSAWKKFNNKPTTKELKKRKLEHPTGALPLITPATAAAAAQLDLDSAPRRLRRAEKVLSERTQRFLLVLERPHDNHNQQAVLRTAECLGIQHVWIVKNVEQKQKKFVANRKITRGSDDWLSVREFQTTTECLMALREDNRQVWVTDLSKTAICLDEKVQVDIPAKVALVIGREADGCSQEMLAAADKRVFLPMYGFSDSFNLSVATALLLQRLFLVCPQARGDLPEEEKHQLRLKWYTQLAKDDEQRRSVYAQWVNNPPAPLDDIRPDERVPIVMKKVMKRITQKEEEVQKEFHERMASSTSTSTSTATEQQ